VGAELHRMHQAVVKTGFSNFADGSERTYSSWGGYLEDFFVLHADLGRLGRRVDVVAVREAGDAAGEQTPDDAAGRESDPRGA
jgi:hypothetical protein